jgi:hypothetical protein
MASRGLLDTSTVILLGDLDAGGLPAEGAISAVTWPNSRSAHSWRRQTSNAVAGRLTSSRPRPTSTRCRLTLPPPGPSAKWPHHFAGAAPRRGTRLTGEESAERIPTGVTEAGNSSVRPGRAPGYDDWACAARRRRVTLRLK